MRRNLIGFITALFALSIFVACGGGDGDTDTVTPTDTIEDSAQPDTTTPEDPGTTPDPGPPEDPGTTPDPGPPEDPGTTPDVAGDTPEPAGTCTNDADLAVIAADPDAPLATTGDCVVNLCLANPTLECVSDCVINGSDKTEPPIEGLPLSEECVNCYAGSSLCGVDNCMAECIADTSAPECGACLAEHCLPAFYACSGLTPPEE